MKIVQIGNAKIKVRSKREQVISYLRKVSKNEPVYVECDDDVGAKIILDYINELRRNDRKLKKIISYAKQRCDDYLEDDYDCEYCDGVFANSRKILQIAGEDIAKYE